MDTAADDELRALRARAYGPKADIAHDPAALARLRQLEGRGSAPDGPEADAVDSPPPRETGVLAETEPQSDTDEPIERLTISANSTGADESDGAAPPDSRAERHRRRRAALWIASVAASSALAAAITFSLTAVSPVSVSPGEQIATLEPNSPITIPIGWFDADEETMVFDFYGLTIFSGGNRAYPAPYSGCLTVVDTGLVPAEEDFDPSGWSFRGEQYSGCGMGAFAPTVLVPFTDATPSEVRSRYPTVTALKFVLDGDRVGVFVDVE